MLSYEPINVKNYYHYLKRFEDQLDDFEKEFVKFYEENEGRVRFDTETGRFVSYEKEEKG